MDVTAAPSWEFGLAPPKINPLPASSITFFATNELTAGPTSTDGSNTSGTKPDEVYWAGHLALPPPVRRLPAWERVPTVAKSQRFSGTIMKRVTVPSFDASSPYSLQASAEARSQADAPKSWRMKLLHRPWEGLKQHSGFVEAPLSEATMTSMKMQARVDVANCMLSQSTTTKPSAHESEYRIVPAKRDLAIEGASRTERIMPGNKLPLYIELRPLLEKAAADGVAQIDMAKASFAHSSAILHDLHQNPRQHLAVNGGPDLSSITDATEPTSPHIISPPRSTAEAKSPVKRDAIPSSPLQNSCSRLKAAKIDLLPAASPRAEPSPTKSASTPSTPLKDGLTTPKLTVTPSLFSPLLGLYPVAEEGASRLGNGVLTPSYRDTSSIFRVGQQPEPSPVKGTGASPSKLPYSVASTPRSEDTRPGKTFQAPSFLQSSMFLDSSSAQDTETEHISPSKFTRPVAPTPSKWNRTEVPSTPLPETPGKQGSLEFLASTPTLPASPALDLSAYNADSPANLSDFDFGPHSLVFAACTAHTALHTEDSRRIKDLHARRRRQSEPLYKSSFKGIQKRRQSASPHKLAQKASAAITNTDSPSSLGFTFKASMQQTDELAQTQPIAGVSTPLKAEDTPRTNGLNFTGVEATTPSIQISPAAEQAASPYPPDTGRTSSDNPGVFNIDVRQNPDIFGIHRPDHAVNRLAQMAEAHCDGHAKVVISQDNGRLIVRFKLPADYASIFPASQGSDESRFTTSPSAISSSPRIRFDHPPSPVSRGRASDLGISFGPRSSTASPSKANGLSYKSPSRPLRSSPLKLPPATQSPIEPLSAGRRSGLWGRMSTSADEDATLIVSDFLDSPAPKSVRSSPRKPALGTPVSTEQLAPTETSDLSILDTPTSNGIGVVDRDTPEHLRFSILHTPFKGTPPAFTPESRKTAPAVAPSPYQATPQNGLSTPLVQPELPTVKMEDATIESTPALEGPVSAVEIETTAQQTSPTPESVPSVGSPRTPPPADVVNSTTPTSSPPLNMSFTPVNRHGPRRNVSSASPEAAPQAAEAQSPTAAPTIECQEVDSVPIVAASPAARIVDDDSPGREYMREFIKRSKPRRVSTLETGSPVAQPAERVPLGAKSPNTVSPQKVKRKLGESVDAQSPLKKSVEPAPKRSRRTVKVPKHKAAMEVDELAAPDPPSANHTSEDADAQEDDAEMDNGPATRRSSRLRVLGRTTTANSKSAIPTPIKLNRPGPRRAAGGPVLNSSVRSEQQDLMHQTRLNTRRNKGNAEYPAQVLARCSQELQEDEVQQKMAEQSKIAKDRKCVGWKEPLEAHQEKPKKSNTAAKTTQKSSGITKQRKTAAVQKAEAAEPRPQRMTRSRTRSQA